MSESNNIHYLYNICCMAIDDDGITKAIVNNYNLYRNESKFFYIPITMRCYNGHLSDVAIGDIGFTDKKEIINNITIFFGNSVSKTYSDFLRDESGKYIEWVWKNREKDIKLLCFIENIKTKHDSLLSDDNPEIGRNWAMFNYIVVSE